jgi:N-acetylglucosaminyl-diphospho-decaprenol L-rhamnosyltransferase
VDPAATVAVIVPSWNSADLLPRCLASVEGQGDGVEVLVVDNGSSDGSLALFEREGVRHLALPRNVGFARAVNLGAAEVGAPLVLPLNADTVLEPGAIARLREALAADEQLGGVQPRLLQLEDGVEMDAASARLYSAGQGLTRDGRAVEIGAGEAQSEAYLRRGEVFGVCGAACLLRRELFDQLGGYDERYFAFYEDVDLNVRARIAGWGFAYVPEAVVWHLGNASWQAGFDRPSAENARLVARNRLATQIKFMSATAIPRIAAVEAGSLARAASQGRFWATLRGKLSALRWLPALLRDRRHLRRDGDLDRARRWLGRS